MNNSNFDDVNISVCKHINNNNGEEKSLAKDVHKQLDSSSDQGDAHHDVLQSGIRLLGIPISLAN